MTYWPVPLGYGRVIDPLEKKMKQQILQEVLDDTLLSLNNIIKEIELVENHPSDECSCVKVKRRLENIVYNIEQRIK